jgi:hypothetical protein
MSKDSKDIASAMSRTLHMAENKVYDRFRKADEKLGVGSASDSEIGSTAIGTVIKTVPEKKTEKVIRYTFCMPQKDFEMIEVLQRRCMTTYGDKLNQSEIVRVGLRALEGLGDEQFIELVNSLPRLKGR